MSELLVRCDASVALGMGHLGRCLALTAAARAAGWGVTFVGRLDTDWAREQVEAARIPVVEEDATGARLVGIAAEAGASAIHLDHYGADGSGALLAACRAAGLVLSNVSDFEYGRRPADVTVDPNFGAVPDPAGRVLSGPHYALVRPEVLEAREARTRVADGNALRVVVVMGGTDPFGVTAEVVAALVRAATVPVVADVVCRDGSLEGRFGRRSGQVELRFQPPIASLAPLLREADAAVSAAGTTVLELACVGVPAALVCVTDNQRRGYEAAVEAGVVVGLGDRAGDADRWSPVLGRMLGDGALRAELTRRGRAAVDGRGAGRVVARIVHEVQARS